MLAEFKFGGGISIKERCCLSLEALEQAHEFTNSQEKKWQRASAELATYTACIEGHWMEARALLYALFHYTEQWRVLIWQFQP